MEHLKTIADLQARIDKLQLEQYQNHMELKSIRQELLRIQKPEQIVITEQQVVQKSSTVNQQRSSSSGMEGIVGLRLLQFAGIIVLIIGIAIGVKYAIDKNLISPALRIALAYLASGLLFFLSYYLSKKYQAFSAILFSGAMAAFYFTTYGAFEYYGFLSRPIAFVLMLLFTWITVFVSLKFNREEIATLALVGAYGVPFLVGGNSGNVLMLYSYMFLINCGILFISFKRNWNILKVLAFAVTWLIFVSWVFIKYSTDYNFVAWLFLILFFIQFLITVCGFRILKRQEPNAGDLVLLILQSFFLYISAAYIYSYSFNEERLAFITLVISMLHLVFCLVSKGLFAKQIFIWQTYLLLFLLLFVLYVPLKFSGPTITIVWISSAVNLFIIGLWQRFRMLRIVSIVLFGITLFKLVTYDSLNFSTIEKIISYVSIGAILLVVAFLYQKYRHLIFKDDVY